LSRIKKAQCHFREEAENLTNTAEQLRGGCSTGQTARSGKTICRRNLPSCTPQEFQPFLTVNFLFH
jgi:hypothetical protein